MPDLPEFIIAANDTDVDLRAGDFHSSPAFREELSLLVEDSSANQTLTISLLPPFSGKFAAPGAIDVIAEVLTTLDSPPRLRILAASHTAIEKLQPRLDRSPVPPRHYLLGPLSIDVIRGDLTETRADGIVNASNTRLELGAGVSGAIRRKAQPGLQDALFAIARRTPPNPGDVIITDSFGLPETHKILHTPTASGNADVIAKALRNCLHHANNAGLHSLAIPALGSGTGGLGTHRFAELATGALQDFATQVSSPTLRTVIIVLWTTQDFEVITEHFDTSL